MIQAIQHYIDECDIGSISEERKEVLQPLVDYIQSKIDNELEVRLNFICTHNSRRSAFAQVWAQTMAHCYGLSNVQCFSGGTESTALFYKVANTLEQVGFGVRKITDSDNPIYHFTFAKETDPVIGFSKRWDDEANPKEGFAAVMTCSHADENCPFIAGADKRIAITYDDPKQFDGTPEMELKYRERCAQIATEMKWAFSRVRLEF